MRSEPIEADERWSLARHLLHDNPLDTVDRAAGLLLLLYAQPLARIATFTVDRLTLRITDHAVQLRLGSKLLVLPPPLDGFVLELADRRHGRAVVGRTQDLSWLLPGGAVGRPISAPATHAEVEPAGHPRPAGSQHRPDGPGRSTTSNRAR